MRLLFDKHKQHQHKQQISTQENVMIEYIAPTFTKNIASCITEKLFSSKCNQMFVYHTQSLHLCGTQAQ